MKRMIFIVFLIPLLLYPAVDLDSYNRETAFKKGISAYVSEDYATAVSIFRQLESQGKVSWELYYNLGNAYFREGRIGPAIQYWEKAKLLAPSEKDISYNLSIAEKHRVDKVVLPDMFPLFRWYESMQRQFPVHLAVRLIGLMLFLLAVILGTFRLHARMTGRSHKGAGITLVSVFAVVIALLAAVSADTAYERKHEKHAVILDESVYILAEPAEGATPLFLLHEGSKVLIEKRIGEEWAKVSYFDDKVGWVRLKHLGEI